MKRSDFFKSLVGVAAIGTAINQPQPPEKLSGTNQVITPEMLEEYIDKKIAYANRVTISARGKDLVAIYDSKEIRG